MRISQSQGKRQYDMTLVVINCVSCQLQDVNDSIKASCCGQTVSCGPDTASTQHMLDTTSALSILSGVLHGLEHICLTAPAMLNRSQVL